MTRTSRSPVLLVLAAVVSVQFGGALAVTLLPLVGVFGSVAMRLGFSVIVLLLVARPRLRGHSGRDWITVALFGLSLAVMNSAFYACLTRLDIGVAVTIEFVGPLLLAASLSRRRRDLVSVVAAALGVVLISEVLTADWEHIDLVGIGLALVAGGSWAAYILLSGRTGAAFPQLEGLTLAMCVAAVIVTPLGILTAGAELLSQEALLKGLGIAVLSSVLPYSLELLALRRLSSRVFGVLLSLEPAVAALAGLLVLSQVLEPMQLAGMLLVVAASATVTRSAKPRELPETA